jgi:hypothetical protein
VGEIQLPLKTDNRRSVAVIWSRCAPFVENSRGILIHRPRTVVTYNTKRRPHIGIGYWCGNHVSGDKTFTFLAAPPEHKLLCVRCEQAAVAAHLPSADALAGRHVHQGRLKAIQTCCAAKEPK